MKSNQIAMSLIAQEQIFWKRFCEKECVLSTGESVLMRIRGLVVLSHTGPYFALCSKTIPAIIALSEIYAGVHFFWAGGKRLILVICSNKPSVVIVEYTPKPSAA